VAAESFWERNATELEFFSTLALVAVTGVYVWLTKQISDASSREVNMLAEQVDAQRAQLELAEAARDHAENVFQESIKARLITSAPAVTVLTSWRERNRGEVVAQRVRGGGSGMGRNECDAPDRNLVPRRRGGDTHTWSGPERPPVLVRGGE